MGLSLGLGGLGLVLGLGFGVVRRRGAFVFVQWNRGPGTWPTGVWGGGGGVFRV